MRDADKDSLIAEVALIPCEPEKKERTNAFANFDYGMPELNVLDDGTFLLKYGLPLMTFSKRDLGGSF